MKPKINIKRVYEDPANADGFRILVDRLWPRGLNKGAVRMDLWAKDIAPSTRLRKWFHQDPGNWKKFREHYWSELDQSGPLADLAKEMTKHKIITLFYAASDEEHNHALVLREYLEKKLS